MVVGGHQRHAALLGNALADRFTVFGKAVIGDDLGTVAAGRIQFGGRGVFGHHDGCGHAQNAGRQGDGLRMVARGESQRAALRLLGREAGQRVVAAPELEGTHALVVLAFEEELCARQFVEGG